MRRETILALIGLLVFITPMLGIPYAWKDGLQFFAGTCTLLIAVAYRMDTRRRERARADVLHEEHNPNSATPDSSGGGV